MPGDRFRPVDQLGTSSEPLAVVHDVLMLDLDGVVYVGAAPVPDAGRHVAAARTAGARIAFVTNNASRPPGAVAAHLRDLGIAVDDADVVTSAQAAARLVSTMVPPGARVLVVGGDGLNAALGELSLVAVSSADDDPVAVVQGFDPGLCWGQLAEGAYAVARGLPWVASNTDTTVPTARGVAPGNGTLVAAIAAATGAKPLVAGKPEPALFDETVARVGGRHPLVVGDRLDTDIEGANNVGCDSLLVMTGVTDLAQLVRADPALRPRYVAPTLEGLLVAHPRVRVDVAADPPSAGCGRRRAALRDGDLVVSTVGRAAPDADDGEDGTADTVAGLRAVVALAWRLTADGGKVPGVAAAQEWYESGPGRG
ncbi:MAG: HAD-IIA family hydrolase [Nocardioidaceae bacterium]